MVQLLPSAPPTSAGGAHQALLVVADLGNGTLQRWLVLLKIARAVALEVKTRDVSQTMCLTCLNGPRKLHLSPNKLGG